MTDEVLEDITWEKSRTWEEGDGKHSRWMRVEWRSRRQMMKIYKHDFGGADRVETGWICSQ